MKKAKEDRTLLKFSSPDQETQVVTVSRILPDNTTETIGKIYSDFNTETDSNMYLSTNNLGEEIFPPTSDFTEIENRFEKYAIEQKEKALVEEYESREISLKSIRHWKLLSETKLINR